MNIYALENHKVKLSESAHSRHCNLYCKLGEIYTVERTVLFDNMEIVYLKEHPGIQFNTIHFDDVTQQTSLDDMRHPNWASFNSSSTGTLIAGDGIIGSYTLAVSDIVKKVEIIGSYTSTKNLNGKRLWCIRHGEDNSEEYHGGKYVQLITSEGEFLEFIIFNKGLVAGMAAKLYDPASPSKKTLQRSTRNSFNKIKSVIETVTNDAVVEDKIYLLSRKLKSKNIALLDFSKIPQDVFVYMHTID